MVNFVFCPYPLVFAHTRMCGDLSKIDEIMVELMFFFPKIFHICNIFIIHL